MKREPVLIILAGLTAVLGAVLEATNALEVTSLTQAEVAAVLAAVGSVLSLVGAAIRGTVVSPATYEEAVAAALAVPTGGVTNITVNVPPKTDPKEAADMVIRQIRAQP